MENKFVYYSTRFLGVAFIAHFVGSHFQDAVAHFGIWLGCCLVIVALDVLWDLITGKL